MLVMGKRQSAGPTPPLGVIDSLGHGLQAVVTHLPLLILPLLLDLFLWLGPQLSIAPLLSQALAFVRANPEFASALNQQLPDPDALPELVAQVGESANLFGFLSTAPMGVPSMMAGRGAPLTPLGASLQINVPGVLAVVIWGSSLTVIGMLLGSIYLHLIARAVQAPSERADRSALAAKIGRSWLHLTLLAFLALGALALYLVPLSVLTLVTTAVHPLLGGLVNSLGAFFAMYVVFTYVFIVQEVVLSGNQLRPALRKSSAIVRTNAQPAAGLLLIILVLNLGLGFVWGIPDASSWLLLLGISFHAFVNTALIAGTFYFYADRVRWQTELQRIIAAQPPATRS